MSVYLFILYVNVFGFMISEEFRPACGQIATRDMLYRAYKNEATGEGYCSAAVPSEVLNVRMSKIRCVLLCVARKCAGVNWKEPGTCEIFFDEPTYFSTVVSCTYYKPGT